MRKMFPIVSHEWSAPGSPRGRSRNAFIVYSNSNPSNKNTTNSRHNGSQRGGWLSVVRSTAGDEVGYQIRHRSRSRAAWYPPKTSRLRIQSTLLPVRCPGRVMSRRGISGEDVGCREVMKVFISDAVVGRACGALLVLIRGAFEPPKDLVLIIRRWRNSRWRGGENGTEMTHTAVQDCVGVVAAPTGLSAASRQKIARSLGHAY